MPNWIPAQALQESGTSAALSEMQQALRGEKETNAFLNETLADLELAMEDVGWKKLGVGEGQDFTAEGRKKIADQATMMLLVNPLIIRGMMLRRSYIWGQGVSISVDDDETGQDVNKTVQRFLEDERNVVTFSGSAAREEIENLLGTTGEVFYCLPTNITTGEVLVRRIEADEIVDIVTNPQDRFTPWFYKRQWSERVIGADGSLGQPVQRKAWYPALGYYPDTRLAAIGGDAVLWDQPVRHRAVNKHGRMTRGVGDVYPAMAWARTTKEVLEAWVILFKALSRFAYQIKGDKPQQAARALQAAASVAPGNPNGTGSTLAVGSAGSLDAVAKSGALLDIEGARWPAMFVASAFGVPVTMLLSDPGQTGARAVAETLDQPTELMAKSRQSIHSEDIEAICRYVVRCSIVATLGKDTLKGDAVATDGREVVTLRGSKGEGPIRVKVEWPDFDSTSVTDKVGAIVSAASTGKLPPEVVLSELLAALKVPDADKIMDANTDDEGKFVDFNPPAPEPVVPAAPPKPDAVPADPKVPVPPAN